jgi:hypothetical protein
MMYRDDIDIRDFKEMTTALRKIKPSIEDYVIVAVEEAREGDQNIGFLMSRTDPVTNTVEEKSVYLAFDYILDLFGPPVVEEEEEPQISG